MPEPGDLAPRSVLITGGSGFVGRHLTALLAQTLPDARLVAPEVDITNAAALADAVREAAPDACVHLAAVAAIPVARLDPDRAWAVNLGGTRNLCRAILAHAPSCRLVLASTADAYGASFRAGRPLDETALLAPLNSYAASKAAADLAVGAMVGEGLQVVRVRPFNHTGAGQSADFALPAFAEQIARIAAGRQKPVLRVGALDPFRDFLDVRDVCAAYAACLTHDLPSGTILNIASGTPRRIGDVLAELLAIAGVDARIEPDPGRMRPSEIAFAVGDAGRARTLLGWYPSVPWRQTLADLLRDWRARMQAADAPAASGIG